MTNQILFVISAPKTIYFNFKKLPFNQAVKLPVYIYKGVLFDSLEGKITIDSETRRAMIHIGENMDNTVLSSLKTRLFVSGELIFNGPSIISKGAVVHVSGILNIGKYCTIGSGSLIKALTKISLDQYSRVTYNCTVMDSELHYVKDIKTGVVKNNKAPIVIGKNCWINAGSIVSKGTVLPDYSITARNSFLNKDYTEFGNNLFLVGAPAKPVRHDVQRIFSPTEERRISKIFEESGEDQIILSPGLFDEKDDVEFIF